MGFGYLIYGFLMMIGVLVPTSVRFGTGIDAFPDLAGYLFFLTALTRLAPYAKGFATGRKWMLGLVPVGMVQFAASALTLYEPWLPVLSVILPVCSLLSALLCPMAFFHLFSGLWTLSGEVDLPKIAVSARRAAVFGFIHYGLELFLTITVLFDLPIAASGSMQIFRIAKQMVSIVYVIYCGVVSYRAYMYICYEGEETVGNEGLQNPVSSLMNKLFKRDPK